MENKLNKEQELALTVSNGLNNLSFNHADFCKQMAKEHRYLQNEFTYLCMEWLRTCAKEDYGYDGRNEYSHKVAQKINKCIGLL